VGIAKDQRQERTWAGDLPVDLFVFGALTIEKELMLLEQEIAEVPE